MPRIIKIASTRKMKLQNAIPLTDKYLRFGRPCMGNRLL
ncbi:hypothetical protein V_ja_00011 [Fowlpox virus]|nr:ALPV-025 [Albatrosspox virus]URH26822.1 hypothetical protein 2755_00011 [Fowlpox virus]URH27614.1 hypothetical protein V_poxine_00011 [Fowlpox virus]URH27877.1 hypothetical protein V_blen_00012 [Fowlpox virus]URH28133.1 hypothetical protein V_cmp_00012 [Fowlpox virus]